MTSETPAPPDTETLLLIGGRRHGETVELPAGTAAWVDLLTADTYRRRPFPYVQVDPQNPRSVALRRGFWLEALVHPDLYDDPGAARSWFTSLALARLYADVGREVPVADIQAWMQSQPGGTASQNGRAGS